MRTTKKKSRNQNFSRLIYEISAQPCFFFRGLTSSELGLHAEQSDLQYNRKMRRRVVLEPFWSENGYRFCPFWSGIGYSLQGIGTTVVYERVRRFNY